MGKYNNAEFLKKLNAKKTAKSYIQDLGIEVANSDLDNLTNQAYYEAYGDTIAQTGDASSLSSLVNNINQSKINNSSSNVETLSTEENIERSNNVLESVSNESKRMSFNLFNGMIDFVEGLGDLIIGGAGLVGKAFGADDTWAKNAIAYDWSKPVAKVLTNIGTPALNLLDPYTYTSDAWDLSEEGITKFEEEVNNNNLLALTGIDWLNEGVGELETTIGRMLPTIIIGIATGGAGTVASVAGQASSSTASVVGSQVANQVGQKLLTTSLMALSSAGSSTEEAINDGGSLEQSALYGVASGATEFATEWMFEIGGKAVSKVGKLFGGNGSNILTKLPHTINGLYGQATKTTLGKIAGNFIEEGLEEVASDLVNPLTKSIYNGKSVGQNYSELQATDLLHSFTIGGISSVILGGGDIIKDATLGKEGRAIKTNIQTAQQLYLDYMGAINDGSAFVVDNNGNFVLDSDGTRIYTEEIKSKFNEIERLADENERLSNSLWEDKNKKKLNRVIKDFTGKSLVETTNDIYNATNAQIEIYKNLATNSENFKSAFGVEINSENGQSQLKKLNNLINYYQGIANNIQNNNTETIKGIINEELNSFTENAKLFKNERIGNYQYNANKLANLLIKAQNLNQNSKRFANLEAQQKDIMNDINKSLKNILNSDNLSNKKLVASRIDALSNLVDNLSDYGVKDASEILDNALNNYIKENTNITLKEQISLTLAKQAMIKAKQNAKLVLQSSDNFTDGEQARVDKKTNTIYINKKYSSKILPLISHEYVSHILVDNLGINAQEKIYNEILKTKEYKELDKVIREEYGFEYDMPVSEMSEDAQAYYKSELVANYIQKMFTEENGNHSELFTKNLKSGSFVRRLLNSLNKVSGKYTNQTILREIKRVYKQANKNSQILKTIDLKVKENQKLTKEEQDIFDIQNKVKEKLNIKDNQKSYDIDKSDYAIEYIENDFEDMSLMESNLDNNVYDEIMMLKEDIKRGVADEEDITNCIEKLKQNLKSITDKNSIEVIENTIKKLEDLTKDFVVEEVETQPIETQKEEVKKEENKPIEKEIEEYEEKEIIENVNILDKYKWLNDDNFTSKEEQIIKGIKANTRLNIPILKENLQKLYNYLDERYRKENNIQGLKQIESFGKENGLVVKNEQGEPVKENLSKSLNEKITEFKDTIESLEEGFLAKDIRQEWLETLNNALQEPNEENLKKAKELVDSDKLDLLKKAIEKGKIEPKIPANSEFGEENEVEIKQVAKKESFKLNNFLSEDSYKLIEQLESIKDNLGGDITDTYIQVEEIYKEVRKGFNELEKKAKELYESDFSSYSRNELNNAQKELKYLTKESRNQFLQPLLEFNKEFNKTYKRGEDIDKQFIKNELLLDNPFKEKYENLVDISKHINIYIYGENGVQNRLNALYHEAISEDTREYVESSILEKVINKQQNEIKGIWSNLEDKATYTSVELKTYDEIIENEEPAIRLSSGENKLDYQFKARKNPIVFTNETEQGVNTSGFQWFKNKLNNTETIFISDVFSLGNNFEDLARNINLFVQQQLFVDNENTYFGKFRGYTKGVVLMFDIANEMEANEITNTLNNNNFSLIDRMFSKQDGRIKNHSLKRALYFYVYDPQHQTRKSLNTLKAREKVDGVKYTGKEIKVNGKEMYINYNNVKNSVAQIARTNLYNFVNSERYKSMFGNKKTTNDNKTKILLFNKINNLQNQVKELGKSQNVVDETIEKKDNIIKEQKEKIKELKDNFDKSEKSKQQEIKKQIAETIKQKELQEKIKKRLEKIGLYAINEKNVSGKLTYKEKVFNKKDLSSYFKDFSQENNKIQSTLIDEVNDILSTDTFINEAIKSEQELIKAFNQIDTKVEVIKENEDFATKDNNKPFSGMNKVGTEFDTNLDLKKKTLPTKGKNQTLRSYLSETAQFIYKSDLMTKLRMQLTDAQASLNDVASELLQNEQTNAKKAREKGEVLSLQLRNAGSRASVIMQEGMNKYQLELNTEDGTFEVKEVEKEGSTKEKPLYEKTTSIATINELIDNFVIEKFGKENIINKWKRKAKNSLSENRLLKFLNLDANFSREDFKTAIHRKINTYMINELAIDSNYAPKVQALYNLLSIEESLKEVEIDIKSLGFEKVEDLFKKTYENLSKYNRGEVLPTLTEIKKLLKEDLKISEKKLNNYFDTQIKNATDANTIKLLTKTQNEIKTIIQTKVNDAISSYSVKSVYGKTMEFNKFFESNNFKKLGEFFDTDKIKDYIIQQEMVDDTAHKATDVYLEVFDDLVKKLENGSFLLLEEFDSIEDINYEEFESAINELKKGFSDPQSPRLALENKIIKEELGDLVENAQQTIRGYFDNSLLYQLKNNLISLKTYNTLTTLYPNYVPLGREFIYKSSEGTIGRDIDNLIQKRKGSNRVIQPLTKSMVNMISSVYQKQAINDYLTTLYKNQIENGTKSDKIIFSKQTEYVEDKVLNIFEEIENYNQLDIDNKIIKFTQLNDDNSLSYYNAKMTDEVYAGFKEIDAYNSHFLDNLFDVIKTPKLVSLFKNLVTSANPFFIGRNLARDVSDAILTTKNGATNYLKNYGKALLEVSKHSPMFELYFRNAGISSSEFSSTDDGKAMLEQLSVYNKDKRSKSPLAFIKRANFIIEQASRFNEFSLSYQNYIKQGMEQSEAIKLAVYDSANITTDFSRGGNISKALNRGLIPFLNAQIQGFCKLTGFVFRERDAKALSFLLLKLVLLGLIPELFNELFMEKNEEYESLPDYTKENYWLIPYGKGQFIKIPKGRISGSVNSFFRNSLRVMQGKESLSDGVKQLGDTTFTNLAPVDLGSGLRTIFSPITDMSHNITWYGQSIDKTSDLNKRESQRYDTETSYIARMIGKAFNYSPKRIDYLLEQYTGVLGDILLPLTSESGNPSKGLATLTNFVNSNMSISSIQNNKYRSEFYNLKTEATYLKNEGKQEGSLLYSYINRSMDELNELEEQIDTIENDAEKYALYLTLRQGYKQAIENGNLLLEKAENININDMSDRVSIAEAYRQVFGSEYALKYYNNQVYERAVIANNSGVSTFDNYYILYMNIKDCDTKEEAIKLINKNIKGTSLKRLVMMKLLGIGLTKEEKLQVKNYLKNKITSEELEKLNLD